MIFKKGAYKYVAKKLLHYKLPLGPNSELDEGEIIFFEVLLEGFDANKAKKFERKSFSNMEKKIFPPLKYLT